MILMILKHVLLVILFLSSNNYKKLTDLLLDSVIGELGSRFNFCNGAGIEYIISDRIFETLPAEEQKLWHSHEYDVIAFHLVI